MLPYWPHSHAAGLSAALSLFEGRFHVGLIASSVTYANPYMVQSGFGSTPLTDPLLSSDTFHVIHDTATHGRAAKTAVLRDQDVVWRNLRVCWSGDDLSGNCGSCDKCLWQMLCMKAVGLDVRQAFPRDIDCDRILNFASADAAHLEEYKACLATAQSNGKAGCPEFLQLKQAVSLAENRQRSDRRNAVRCRLLSTYGMQRLVRRLRNAA